MVLDAEKTTGHREYKVRDLSQIEHAEVEMPGLMASRAEFGPSQPFKGARITDFRKMGRHTRVVVENLNSLGAKVRCCSGETFSTQDHAASTIASDSSSVSKGETREEYWLCISRALDWGHGGVLDMIIGDGGDATFLISEGVKAEEIYEKTGEFPDPSSTDDAELRIVLSMIGDGLKVDPMRYHKMKERLVGVSVETADAAERLYQMQANGRLLFPAINVNNSVTMSEFINLYGCRYAVLDGIKRATNMAIPGKRAVVCGYDDASKGCAIALRLAGANVVVYTDDSNHAVRAGLGRFEVKTLDDVDPEADIFVTNIRRGNMDVVKYVKKMKNNAIIYNMDPILDLHSNIYAGVEQCFSGMKRTIVNLETDKWFIPETNSSIIVLSNTGYPDLMRSWSCTSHLVAMLELWNERGTGKYENKVYDLPEHLEEKVSALHLAKLLDASVATRGGPEKGDKIKRILKVIGPKACGFFGMVALGLMNNAHEWCQS
ncbi:adenosylhomocysteinase-like [Neltuma alba]|uniref:adenosylhomocysteinase-like n=1 Tax=Neltuma alba TaxID=207710 RepID=UPI0010A2C799|nr:adenosylhomocysteinase-like [Prosopis alba]